MHHTFSATLADSRQRELSALARRPDHLMARALELALPRLRPDLDPLLVRGGIDVGDGVVVEQGLRAAVRVAQVEAQAGALLVEIGARAEPREARRVVGLRRDAARQREAGGIPLVGEPELALPARLGRGGGERVHEPLVDGDDLAQLVHLDGPPLGVEEEVALEEGGRARDPVRIGGTIAAEQQRSGRDRRRAGPRVLDVLEREAQAIEGREAPAGDQAVDDDRIVEAAHAVELALASVHQDRRRIVAEAADLLYHVLVLLRYHDIALADVTHELSQRQR